MAGLTHRCRESENPRNKGFCACGKRLVRLRNVGFERDVTVEASKGAVDPSRLIEYSELRAEQPHGYVTDSQQVRTGRDWLHESRAELADCRNYLCWWLEESLADERQDDVLEALRFVALAFDRLESGP